MGSGDRRSLGVLGTLLASAGVKALRAACLVFQQALNSDGVSGLFQKANGVAVCDQLGRVHIVEQDAGHAQGVQFGTAGLAEHNA